MSIEGLKRNEKENFLFIPQRARWLYLRYLYTFNECNTASRKKPRCMGQPQYVCFYLQYTTVLIFNARSFQQRYMICIHCLRVTFFCNIFFLSILLHDQRSSSVIYIPHICHFCIMHSPATTHQPLVYYRK